jgi:hypothetical protein
MRHVSRSGFNRGETLTGPFICLESASFRSRFFKRSETRCVAFHKTLGTTPSSEPRQSRNQSVVPSGPTSYFRSKQPKQQRMEVAMTVIISNNDGLARLREEARRRRRARCKGAVKARHTSAPRPSQGAPDPANRMIVGDWYTDELGDRTRIIKRA